MQNKQCARLLSDNVQCDGLVASSLTGEYCTKCYFEMKRKSDSHKQDTPDEINQGKSNENQNRMQESENKNRRLQNETISSQNMDGTELSVESESNKEYEIEKEHHPNKDSDKIDTEIKKDPTKKYCQSCIERGYGLKLATREWTKDYFICDKCFEPLLNNLVTHDTTRSEIEKIKTNTAPNVPFLQQFYSLLKIPEPLQFMKSDDVLRHRNEIFNYHAPALVNMNLDEIKEQIENYQVMLFQIKVGLEPLTDYINKVKQEERNKANIEGIKKSKTEVGKTSKVKMSKEEKEAKALGLTLEKYQEMVKKAKLREFNKITGSSDDDNAAPMIK